MVKIEYNNLSIKVSINLVFLSVYAYASACGTCSMMTAAIKHSYHPKHELNMSRTITDVEVTQSHLTGVTDCSL